MTSILELAEAAADELSLARPTTLVGNTSQDEAMKLLRHLTRVCRFLAGRTDWQVLRREQTHTTLAAAAQTGAIPTDFLRFVPESFYNRTTRTRVTGPLTADEWQSHQATLMTRVYDAYTVRGNTLYIAPTPPAGETLAFEYITKAIGTDTTGATARTAFTVDTDVTYFDDELVIAGMVWRYRKAEGQDYSEEFRDFELRLFDMMKQDGGRRRLDMSGSDTDRLPVPPRVPDTLVFPS